MNRLFLCYCNMCVRAIEDMLKITCVALVIGAIVLIFFHPTTGMFGNSPYEGNIGSMRYIVHQLGEEITELTAKHSQLHDEMNRLSDRLSSSFSSTGAVSESVNHDTSSRRLPRYEYSYDKQMADFALESAGARIIDTGGTIEHVIYDSHVSRVLYTISSIMCRGCDGARIMLQPGSLPGECWAFKGSRGEAVIQLLGNINLTGVAMEHIPAEISPTGDISSAPRIFQLEGLDDTSSRRVHDFGKFEYNRDGPPIQYFNVVWPATRYFNLVRVRFLSNWGHPEYTCVYRVRVHGQLAPGQTYIASEKGDG